MEHTVKNIKTKEHGDAAFFGFIIGKNLVKCSVRMTAFCTYLVNFNFIPSR
jgi:hypothetical protein